MVLLVQIRAGLVKLWKVPGSIAMVTGGSARQGKMKLDILYFDFPTTVTRAQAKGREP